MRFSLVASPGSRVFADNSIENIYDDILRASQADHVLTLQDLLRCISADEFYRHRFTGFWVYKDRINPSLSFQRGENDSRIFRTEKEANKSLSDAGVSLKSAKEDVSRCIYSNNYLLFFSEPIVFKDAHYTLLSALSTVCRRSANATNITLNLNNRISNRVNGIFAKSRLLEFSPLLHLGVPNLAAILQRGGCVVSIINDEIVKVSGYKNRTADYTVAAGIEEIVSRNLDEVLISYDQYAAIMIAGQQFNVLIQPVQVGGERENAKYYICLYSNTPFHHRDLYNTYSFATTFEDVYRRSKKLELLILARSASKSASHLEAKVSHQFIEDSFVHFSKCIASELFSIINCHSFTIRLYDPRTNSLQLKVSEHAASGRRDSTRSAAIKINQYKDSLNAFTFLVGTHHFEYVYLQNVRGSVPAKYKELGLNSSLAARARTKSELTMPFRYGRVTIGTINLESTSADAFDEDVEFLVSLKRLFEDKYASYFDKSDLSWTQKLAKFADPLHELSNYLSTELFTPQQKTLLKSLFFPDVDGSEDVKITTLGNLEDVITQWIYKNFDEESQFITESISSMITIDRKSKSTKISKKVFSVISSIIKNLIINIINYSFVESDKILVSAAPRFRSEGQYSGNEDYIRVRLRTAGPFDQADLDVLCLHPIKRASDFSRPEHFGMYTLGLLTRSIAGYVLVCPPSQSEGPGETLIEFILPIGLQHDEKS